MIVFKNYFKFIRKHIPIIIMYSAIFLGITTLVTLETKTESTFVSSKIDVAIINRDKNSSLIDGFVNYIEKNANIIELEDDKETLKDALFFYKVEYILIIPDNFTKDFLSGKNPKIDTLNKPNSYETIYVESLLNRYLNIANIYAVSDFSEEEIASYIEMDLSKSANVLFNTNKIRNNFTKMSVYYNFFNYTFIMLGILSVSVIIKNFKEKNIKKRIDISSYKQDKFNKELFLGNLCLILLIWSLYVIISIILYPGLMLTMNGLLTIINSFIFSITILALAFLIGNNVTASEAINGIANILGLGTSFICGAFVPQAILGNSVLGVAKIFPSYWYIKNNDFISNMTDFNFDTIKPLITNSLIVLSFGLLLFIINLVISKYKLRKKI